MVPSTAATCGAAASAAWCAATRWWRPGLNAATAGVIEAVHPRHSVLTRPDFYDGVKPIAANIDQIIIVLGGDARVLHQHRRPLPGGGRRCGR